MLLGYHYERLLFSLRSIGILSPMSYAQSWIRAPEHPFFPSAYRSLVRISNKLLALPKSSCPANTKSSTSKICIVNGGILVGMLQRNRTKGDVYIYMSISSILRNSLTLIQRQETPKFAGVGVRPKIQGRAYVAIQVQRLLAEFSLV